MSINHYIQRNILIIFLCITYPSLISCSFRGTLDGAAIFEAQVRNGDLLPKAMVELVCTNNQIRFLVIGGGVAAADNIFKNQTYPYLTCKSDTIVASDINPGRVAQCMKKMIGENIYDAIILDIFDFPGPQLIKLVARLVQRFPMATIINLRHFFPGDVGLKHRKGWVSVATWAESINEKSMTETALQKFEETDRQWGAKLNAAKEKAFEDNINQNYIWFLYKDTKDKFNLFGDYWQKTVLKRAWMYDDWFLHNAYGHQDIARGILGMMIYNKTETKRSDFVNPWDNDDVGAC